MGQQYVTRSDDTYRIGDSCVSLDSIVYAYLSGQTAESIAQAFPSVTLEQVYGAIAFYLSRQAEIDAYLRQGRADFDALREESRRQDPMFYQKLAAARTEHAVP